MTAAQYLQDDAVIGRAREGRGSQPEVDWLESTDERGLYKDLLRRLFASVAFEIDHLAFHFLAGGVGGGAHALNAEFKFVGV
jgi:hypothetical protein